MEAKGRGLNPGYCEWRSKVTRESVPFAKFERVCNNDSQVKIMKKYIVGVDVGGTKIATGITDRKGVLKNKVILPTLAKEGVKVSIQQVYSSIETVIRESKINKKDILGIGIGAPGPLDPARGIVINPPNLNGWKNVPLVDMVKKKFKKPVKLENDANAAGMAEVLWGAAVGYKHVLYVTISTGVGNAIIIDGKIYHGKNGMAGEGGHITINHDDADGKCICGNVGCVEALASGPSTVRRFLKKNVPGKHFPKKPKSAITMIDLEYAARAGDKAAQKIISEQSKLIGIWLGGMISILDPEIIVIGGGVSNMKGIFFKNIRETIPKHSINLYAKKTKVVRAKLRGDVGILGAASIMM